jgi:hypothetical protein
MPTPISTAIDDTTTVGELLQADAAECAQIAEPRDPERQRRENERQHQHEQQPEKDLAEGHGDAPHELLQSRCVAERHVRGHAQRDAER